MTMFRSLTHLLAIPLFGLLFFLIGDNDNVALAQSGNTFYGIDYGVDIYACPSYETMKNDFATIKQYTNRMRIFGLGLCNQGEFAIRATQELGMRLYLTLWIDQHENTFEKEFQILQDLLARHQFNNVDAIIVGSEVLYRNDAPIGTLLGYIQRVKEVAGGVPVTSTDTFNKITPELAAPLDFVMINVFPFWEGVSIEQAAGKLMEHYDETIRRVGGNKIVRISETGWPSGGSNLGQAIASPENQNRYLREVLCRTRQRNIDMLWFSAIDEPYKNGVEGHFGVLDAVSRNLKPYHQAGQLSDC